METVGNDKVAYNKHNKNKYVSNGGSGCIWGGGGGGGGVNRGEFCIIAISGESWHRRQKCTIEKL